MCDLELVHKDILVEYSWLRGLLSVISQLALRKLKLRLTKPWSAFEEGNGWQHFDFLLLG